MANLFTALADFVALIHLAYIVFVVVGFALIVVGAVLGWDWVRSFWFRFLHLAAIAIVCVETLTDTPCVLTILEDNLRMYAGEATYGNDFIGYWTDRLIFHNAPQWIFTAAYLGFGAIVAATFWLAPPRLRWRDNLRKSEG